ncbi:MAG: mechanosensitive ion channel, partial [Thiobacillus sp.]|nr:mechanosensitive ion channel [Thiobacillus sp.]
LFNVVIILALAWLALRLSRKGLARLRERMQAGGLADFERVKRINTLEQVFRYAIAVIIILVTGMLVLSQLGISIAPILAAAGVLGIAIGFGAQSLVKDYFTGLFLLLENQVRQGDVVEIAGKGGLVEEMTLRYIRLRDYEGSVHYVPNGTIDSVTNRSRGFAFAVIDIGVAYREDVDEVYAVMREVGAALRADPEISAKIEDDLEIAGVDKWADSAVVIRCRFKVRPLEQWGVRRAYLYRLKKAFDAADIEIWVGFEIAQLSGLFEHLLVRKASGLHPGQDIIAGAVHHAHDAAHLVACQPFGQGLDYRDSTCDCGLEPDNPALSLGGEGEVVTVMGQQGLVGGDHILARRDGGFGRQTGGAFVAAHDFDKDIDIVTPGEGHRIGFPRIV